MISYKCARCGAANPNFCQRSCFECDSRTYNFRGIEWYHVEGTDQEAIMHVVGEPGVMIQLHYRSYSYGELWDEQTRYLPASELALCKKPMSQHCLTPLYDGRHTVSLTIQLPTAALQKLRTLWTSQRGILQRLSAAKNDSDFNTYLNWLSTGEMPMEVTKNPMGWEGYSVYAHPQGWYVDL